MNERKKPIVNSIQSSRLLAAAFFSLVVISGIPGKTYAAGPVFQQTQAELRDAHFQKCRGILGTKLTRAEAENLDDECNLVTDAPASEFAKKHKSVLQEAESNWRQTKDAYLIVSHNLTDDEYAEWMKKLDEKQRLIDEQRDWLARFNDKCTAAPAKCKGDDPSRW